MILKLYGFKDKRHKSLIKDAVVYGASLLMTKRLCDTLEISVRLNPTLMEKNKSVAEVEWLDTHYRAKSFNIELDADRSWFMHVLSIMHEIVHVKQYAKGEMVQSMKYSTLTKFHSDWIDDEKTNYYDLPWEVEAHGREKGMFVRWMKQTNLLTPEEKLEWEDKFLF